MYKLLHKLFGWDYIAWNNSADHGIAKVIVLPDGKICYYRYKSTKLIDIIHEPKQVLWLTCKPEKYFSEEQ